MLNENVDNLKKVFDETNADMSIVVKKINNANRYGSITMTEDDNNKIARFDEKQENINEAIINAGVYIIKKQLIEKIPDKKISLEKELIPEWLKNNIKITACFTEADFIDIGTKESLDYIRNN